jgi:cell division protein FtsB
MDPDLALIVIAVISLTAIVGRTVVKITNARLAAGAGQSDELKARVEELESTVHGLQQELVEAQERLDFAERLLAKGSGQT